MNSYCNPSFIFLRVRNRIADALTDGMQSTIMDQHTLEFSTKSIQNRYNRLNQKFYKIFRFKDTYFSY